MYESMFYLVSRYAHFHSIKMARVQKEMLIHDGTNASSVWSAPVSPEKDVIILIEEVHLGKSKI